MSSRIPKGLNNRFFLAIGVVFAGIVLFLFAPVYTFYSDKHPVLDKIRERFTVLDPQFAKIPLRLGDKAYTEDKSIITLCITNPKTGKLYDLNTLMYVALHELAHCITKADGDHSHGEEFKHNFTKLLKVAEDKGIYDASQPIPVAYCGVDN